MDHLLSLSWWFSMFGQTWGWWLACEVIALVFAPLVLRWFRALPDRGLGLAPALGVLLVTYTAWVWSFRKGALGILGLLLIAAGLVALGLWLEGRGKTKWRNACYALTAPFVLGCVPWPHGTFSIALSVAVWAAVGAAFWWDDWKALWQAWKRRWALWLVVQILFTAGFLFFSNVRSYVPWASFEPGMSGAEKFDNLAHINSCMRATTMPPQDAWWAGKTINYYYGGHLISATVAKLTGTSAGVAFNLGLAMVFALTLTSGFSLTFNVVNRLARLWRPQWSAGWAKVRSPLWIKGMGWGVLGAVAIAMFGNLDPWHQVLSRDDAQMRAQYDRIYSSEIEKWIAWQGNLEKARRGNNKMLAERLESNPEGVPPANQLSKLELRFAWPNLTNVDFWRSSRMLKGSITEFPYFSAILGDHHAHHYALPFSMIALTAAAGLLRKGARWKSRRSVLRWLSAAWVELFAMAFLIGAVMPINAWDVIVLIPLYLLAVLVAMTGLVPERWWRWVTALILYGTLMIGAGLLLNARPGMLAVIQTPATLALPIVLLAVPILLEEFRPGTLPLWVKWAIVPAFVAALGVAVVATKAVSGSDAFLILAVLGGIGLWQAVCDGRLYRWWGASLAVYGAAGVLGVMASLPFKLYFESPFGMDQPFLVSKFPPMIAPAVWSAPEFWQAVWMRLPVNPQGIAPVRSQLRDYLGHWGIFWIPIIILWFGRLISVSRRWERGKGFALWFVLLAVLYLTFNKITNSWVAPITLTMSAGCLVLAFSLRRDPRGAAIWTFLTVAFFYSFFVEVLHFDDRYVGELERYNTPFKIYYPLWAPMAVGMCVMLKELAARVAPSVSRYGRPWLRLAPWAGIATLVALFLWLASTSLFGLALTGVIVFAAAWGGTFAFESLRPKGVSVSTVASDLLSRLAWRAPLTLCVLFILAVGMLYPVGTTAGRTNWLHDPNVIPVHQKSGPEEETYTRRTLDSTAYLGNKPKYADDYKVIRWINENIEGSPVIVERVGEGAYQVGSRFATNTGLPTILGWEHHELQWRGWGNTVSQEDMEKYGEDLKKRKTKPDKNPEYVQMTGMLREQVDKIYRSAKYEEIRPLLKVHTARYVVVGSLEREAYEKDFAEGLKKFDKPPFEKVFESGQTSLYKVPE